MLKLSERLLDGLLTNMVKNGALSVVYPSGAMREYGEERAEVTFEIRDGRTLRGLLLDPSYQFGEAYANGDITVTKGSVYDLIKILFRNVYRYKHAAGGKLMERFRKVLQSVDNANPIPRSIRNVRCHYDIDERLYRLFLDGDLQYSCGYFEHPEMSLEEAQKAKKRHIIAKLNIPDSGRVLDIGCGWGGLAISIAKAHPRATVLGVTLSPRQFEVARNRVKDESLSNRVKFQLKDYRQLDETFDRIISVGMFEHVGPRDYGVFFEKVRDLLSSEGMALLHTIGQAGRPRPTNPWIRKHIFPGGHIPALSEIISATDKADIIVGDVETLRLHYAETLRHWRHRFAENRDMAAHLYDEQFCRMWELYLAGSEASFRYLDFVVFQIQLMKSVSAAPITRDYMQSPAPSIEAGRAVAA